MIDKKYISKIAEIVKPRIGKNDRVFIFGSSVDQERFTDVDLGVVSENQEIDKEIYRIKDELEESALPYKFDVVNMNKTKKSFRARALNGPKVWII